MCAIPCDVRCAVCRLGGQPHVQRCDVPAGGVGRAGQVRASRSGPVQGEAGWGRAERARPRQGTVWCGRGHGTEQDRAGRDTMGQGRADYDMARAGGLGMAGRDRAEQGKAGRGRVGQGEALHSPHFIHPVAVDPPVNPLASTPHQFDMAKHHVLVVCSEL